MNISKLANLLIITWVLWLPFSRFYYAWYIDFSLTSPNIFPIISFILVVINSPQKKISFSSYLPPTIILFILYVVIRSTDIYEILGAPTVILGLIPIAFLILFHSAQLLSKKTLQIISLMFLIGTLVNIFFWTTRGLAHSIHFNSLHYLYYTHLTCTPFGQYPTFTSYGLSVALIILNTNAKQVSKLYIVAFTAIIIFGYLQGSKSGIISLYLAQLSSLIFILKFKRLRSKLISIFLATIVFIGMFTLSPRLNAMASFLSNPIPNQLTEAEDTSTFERLTFIRGAIPTLKKTWLWGEGTVGRRSTPTYKRELKKITSDNCAIPYSYSHNQFVDTWLQTGIVGFILLIVIVFSPLLKAIKEKNPIAITLILLTIFYMGLESILFPPYGARLFGFLWVFYIPLLWDKKDSLKEALQIKPAIEQLSVRYNEYVSKKWNYSLILKFWLFAIILQTLIILMFPQLELLHSKESNILLFFSINVISLLRVLYSVVIKENNREWPIWALFPCIHPFIMLFFYL